MKPIAIALAAMAAAVVLSACSASNFGTHGFYERLDRSSGGGAPGAG